jgi:protein-S-isoprenylcysteine O-methyltransferase Ste14
MGEKRLSRFGIGPMIAVPSLLLIIAVVLADARWPHVFVISSLPQIVPVFGVVLMACGVGMWAVGAVAAMRAYDSDRLVTSGVYALVRHPMYGGWITLGFPGLALILKSWLMLVTPLIAYAIFKRMIHREDEYLEQRFGQAYRDYRNQVNEVLPLPRFGRKGAQARAAQSGR